MIPAGRLFVALGLVAGVLAVAAAEPRLLLGGLLLDVLLVLAAAVDARRAAATPLQAHRLWPSLLVQDTATEVAVRIENRSSRDVMLRCREGLHPGLAAHPARARLTLPAGTSVTWRHALTPRRRGAHELLPLTARVLGPWGLAWAQRDLLAGDVRRVYPRLRWDGHVGHLLRLAQRRELGRVEVGHRGEGSEPYALRDYLPGDPPRLIHWKATARHGHPVTRERTLERGARVVVLLDCARAMTAVDDGRSKLDHALAAALALARVASARGDRVSVIAFADRVLREVRISPGSRGIGQAYRVLHDVEARLVEPAYDVAAERACAIEPRRALVLVLSSVVDLAAAELLREALLRLSARHRPVLINLEDPELQRLALAAPEDAAAAFAKTSALGILVANRDLARRLRRSGMRVVTVGADRLALDTIDAYLSLLAPRARRVS